MSEKTSYLYNWYAKATREQRDTISKIVCSGSKPTLYQLCTGRLRITEDRALALHGALRFIGVRASLHDVAPHIWGKRDKGPTT